MANDTKQGPPTRNLWQRMSAITEGFRGLEKRGTAPKEVGGYPYYTAGDVSALANQLAVKHGVQIVPSVIKHRLRIESSVQKQTFRDGTTKEVTKHAFITQIGLRVTYINVDDPRERDSVEFFGYGIDSQDKSIGKAQTYALKDALMKTFLGSEGGLDPEIDPTDYAKETHEREAAPPPAPRTGNNGHTKKPEASAATMTLPTLLKKCADAGMTDAALLVKCRRIFGKEVKALTPDEVETFHFELFGEMPKAAGPETQVLEAFRKSAQKALDQINMAWDDFEAVVRHKHNDQPFGKLRFDAAAACLSDLEAKAGIYSELLEYTRGVSASLDTSALVRDVNDYLWTKASESGAKRGPLEMDAAQWRSWVFDRMEARV